MFVCYGVERKRAHHVGREYEHTFMFSTWPLGVVQKVGVILPEISGFVPCGWWQSEINNPAARENTRMQVYPQTAKMVLWDLLSCQSDHLRKNKTHITTQHNTHTGNKSGFTPPQRWWILDFRLSGYVYVDTFLVLTMQHFCCVYAWRSYYSGVSNPLKRSVLETLKTPEVRVGVDPGKRRRSKTMIQTPKLLVTFLSRDPFLQENKWHQIRPPMVNEWWADNGLQATLTVLAVYASSCCAVTFCIFTKTTASSFKRSATKQPTTQETIHFLFIPVPSVRERSHDEHFPPISVSEIISHSNIHLVLKTPFTIRTR